MKPKKQMKPILESLIITAGFFVFVALVVWFGYFIHWVVNKEMPLWACLSILVGTSFLVLWLTVYCVFSDDQKRG